MRHEAMDGPSVVVSANDVCDRERIETPEERDERLTIEQAHEDYIRRCEWLADYQDANGSTDQ